MNKRVTLSDVAKKAGVSRAAASATLSGKDGKNIRISAEKKEEILRTARTLGFVPNTAAQYLKSGGNNHIIAVFTYEPVFPFDPGCEYYPFFAGIQAAAEKEGYDILILNNWSKDKSRSSRICLASGAIMIGIARDDEQITSLVKQRFPLVFVGRRKIGNGIPVHYVAFSYQPSVERIVCLVASHSSGYIAYIRSSISDAEPSEDKSNALHASAKALGIDVIDIFIERELSKEDIEKILEIRCVIFDRLFIADLFESVMEERGLSLGKDVFGAILEDDWTGGHERWTRWENRRRELGSLAVRHIVAMYEGTREEDSYVLLPIIESDSTGTT